jgi:calcineurin-like phosphoesterase
VKILYIGDIVAKIGRRAVGQVLPKLKEEKQIDFVIAQAENMSTGNGISKKAFKEMQDAAAITALKTPRVSSYLMIQSCQL